MPPPAMLSLNRPLPRALLLIARPALMAAAREAVIRAQFAPIEASHGVGLAALSGREALALAVVEPSLLSTVSNGALRALAWDDDAGGTELLIASLVRHTDTPIEPIRVLRPVGPATLDAAIAAAVFETGAGVQLGKEAWGTTVPQGDADEPAPATRSYATVTQAGLDAPRNQTRTSALARGGQASPRFKKTRSFLASQAPSVRTHEGTPLLDEAPASGVAVPSKPLSESRWTRKSGSRRRSAPRPRALNEIDTEDDDPGEQPTSRLPALTSGLGPLPTAMVGEHLLLSVLGQGGMATVYRAREMSTGREVALKVLDRSSQSPKSRARFRREMALCQRLVHDNVVRTFTFGEWQERLYFTMELLRGRDLAAQLEQAGRPLPLAQVIDIGLQSCAGLAVAHAAGVVHRDIKPHNLFLTDRGVLKITDFGVARSEDMRVTATGDGGLLGTPAYMPPERLRIGACPDPRGDIYSLGATLYQLLTGRLPFEAPDLPTMVAAIVLREPEPPSSLVEGVSPALDAVILRAMARDPDARFPDCAALQDALLRVGT